MYHAIRSVVAAVQQLVCVLIGQHHEFGRGLKAHQDLNAPAAGRAQRAVEFWDVVERDALRSNRGPETACLGARITGRFAGSGNGAPSVWATSNT